MKRTFALIICALMIALTMPAAPALTQDPGQSMREQPMRMSEIVRVIANRLKVQFLYDNRQMESQLIYLTGDGAAGPMPTFETDGACWRWLDCVLLSRGYGWQRLNAGQKLYRILSLEELGRMAHPVVTDPSQIEDDVMWVTMSLQLRYADPAYVQRALLNLMTRPGGVVMPISVTNGLLISDHRNQIPNLYAAVVAIDKAPDTVVSVVEVPAGAPGKVQVVEHLSRLFAHEVKSGRVAFSTDDNNEPGRIFIRMERELETQVLAAAKAIIGK